MAHLAKLIERSVTSFRRLLAGMSTAAIQSPASGSDIRWENYSGRSNDQLINYDLSIMYDVGGQIGSPDSSDQILWRDTRFDNTRSA